MMIPRKYLLKLRNKKTGEIIEIPLLWVEYDNAYMIEQTFFLKSDFEKIGEEIG